MAHLIETPFSAYSFTDDELREVTSISGLQKMFFQTTLASCATDKIALEFDADHPLRFAQQEAYLKGQIDIINYFLGLSERKEVTRPNKFEKT